MFDRLRRRFANPLAFVCLMLGCLAQACCASIRMPTTDLLALHPQKPLHLESISRLLLTIVSLFCNPQWTSQSRAPPGGRSPPRVAP